MFTGDRGTAVRRGGGARVQPRGWVRGERRVHARGAQGARRRPAERGVRAGRFRPLRASPETNAVIRGDGLAAADAGAGGGGGRDVQARRGRAPGETG